MSTTSTDDARSLFDATMTQLGHPIRSNADGSLAGMNTYRLEGWTAAMSTIPRAQPRNTVQNLLHGALGELLDALPERRDWLNPDVEKLLRAIHAGPKVAGAELDLRDLAHLFAESHETGRPVTLTASACGLLLAAMTTAPDAPAEGELPALPKSDWVLHGSANDRDAYTVEQMLEFRRQGIAADRASRQVANKAEVEPTSLTSLMREASAMLQNSMFQFCATTDKAFELAQRINAALATPPATTGASTAQSIDTPEFRKHIFCVLNAHPRDKAMAALIAHIDQHFKGSVGASTVLTDERTAFEAEFDNAKGAEGSQHDVIGWYYFNDEVEAMWKAWQARAEVAAQAGQVAVQGWIDIDATEPPEHELIALRYWPYGNSENPQAVTGGRYIDGTYYNDEGDEMHPPSHWCRLPYFDAEATAKASTSGERQEGGAA